MGEFFLLCCVVLVCVAPILVIQIAYETFRDQRRIDAEKKHRHEMQRMDKLLEMHKAGMKVELNPSAPVTEPPKEVVSDEPKPPA